MDITPLFMYDNLRKIPEVAATKAYEGNIAFYTTTFDEIVTTEDYINVERYYSFDVYDYEYTDSFTALN